MTSSSVDIKRLLLIWAFIFSIPIAMNVPILFTSKDYRLAELTVTKIVEVGDSDNRTYWAHGLIDGKEERLGISPYGYPSIGQKMKVLYNPNAPYMGLNGMTFRVLFYENNIYKSARNRTFIFFLFGFLPLIIWHISKKYRGLYSGT
jgi:hypothetical protein